MGRVTWHCFSPPQLSVSLPFQHPHLGACILMLGELGCEIMEHLVRRTQSTPVKALGDLDLTDLSHFISSPLLSHWAVATRPPVCSPSNRVCITTVLSYPDRPSLALSSRLTTSSCQFLTSTSSCLLLPPVFPKVIIIFFFFLICVWCLSPQLEYKLSAGRHRFVKSVTDSPRASGVSQKCVINGVTR